MSMSCPRCGSINTKVIESKNTDNQTCLIRRRQCNRCGERWNTVELYSELGTKKNVRSDYFQRSIHKELNSYRSQAIEAAKELCYPPDVITKINGAENTVQISQIMATARKRKFG